MGVGTVIDFHYNWNNSLEVFIKTIQETMAGRSLVSADNGIRTSDVLDTFFNDFLGRDWASPTRRSRIPGRSKADIVERDDHYELQMDMPGVEKDDVNIHLTDGNRLNIQANRTDSRKEEEGDFLSYAERQSSYSYSMNLGDNVDTENIEAELDSGVLTVNLPKQEVTEEDHTEIEVQ